MDLPAFLAVPAYAAAVALVFAAAHKLIRPQQTYIALRLVKLPNGRGAVVALAALEALTGMAVLISRASVFLVLMGVLYLVFAAFLMRARGVGVACGCLTDSDRPPGWPHIGLDVCAALVALAAAAVV